MLHPNKSDNLNTERWSQKRRKKESVDSRSGKGCVYARGTGTMLSASDVCLCVFLWGESKYAQLVMANVSEHLTGNEQDSHRVFVCVLVAPSFRLMVAFLLSLSYKHAHTHTAN